MAVQEAMHWKVKPTMGLVLCIVCIKLNKAFVRTSITGWRDKTKNTLKSFRIYRPSSMFMCRERMVSILDWWSVPCVNLGSRCHCLVCFSFLYVLKSLFQTSNVPIFYTVYCVVAVKVILLKLHFYVYKRKSDCKIVGHLEKWVKCFREGNNFWRLI